jgi:predicted RNase H-like HicB family nuclease
MSYTFSAIIEKDGKLYFALCPELDVASQGKTIETALANLKEAVSLYLECASPKELKSVLSSHPFVTTLEVTV